MPRTSHSFALAASHTRCFPPCDQVSDDLTSWKRGGESFELHEGSTCPPVDGFAAANQEKAFNGAEHWLRRLVPLARPCELAPPASVFQPVRESLCEFPHAAQDRDTGQPFRRPGKRSVPR